MTTDPFERAVRRTAETTDRQRRAGFRIHLAVYVAVQVLLVATWAVVWGTGGTAFPWPLFPLLGWGIGVVAHYVAIRSALDDTGDVAAG